VWAELFRSTLRWWRNWVMVGCKGRLLHGRLGRVLDRLRPKTPLVLDLIDVNPAWRPPRIFLSLGWVDPGSNTSIVQYGIEPAFPPK